MFSWIVAGGCLMFCLACSAQKTDRKAGSIAKHPWSDTRLSPNQRAAMVLAEMTLEEKRYLMPQSKFMATSSRTCGRCADPLPLVRIRLSWNRPVHSMLPGLDTISGTDHSPCMIPSTAMDGVGQIPTAIRSTPRSTGVLSRSMSKPSGLTEGDIIARVGQPGHLKGDVFDLILAHLNESGSKAGSHLQDGQKERIRRHSRSRS
jgi:hypothetical protein